MRVLITGGCGFIGHHMVEHFLKATDWEICVLDSLNYASRGFDRVRDIQVFDDHRVTFFSADLTRPVSDGVSREIKGISYILHLAAETHVDNSIKDPMKFVQSNIVGTTNLLLWARDLKELLGFCYFSTDEVFGPAEDGVNFKEWDRYNCTNPYAASKAGAEEMCLAFANTYSMPIFVVHCMNVFGERQHPEKFIPICIRKIRDGETLQIHADPTGTKSGSRFYIHARNVASAVHFLLNKFGIREKYNIVGEQEVTNADLAAKIAGIMEMDYSFEMVDFHSSRPGHDLRYALDGSKMHELGWTLPMTFDRSLEKTVNWTLSNKKWLEV
jgi:dTDP-glucose 4,6-dehydratase